MNWTDDEIDELLVRYIDQDLSSDELERFERLLTIQPSVRQKLSNWKRLKLGLSNLAASKNSSGRILGASFADRIIQASQQRVRESGDAKLAPWIRRDPSSTTVDSAKRIQERDLEPALPSRQPFSTTYKWVLGLATSGIAASLIAIAYWSHSPGVVPESLIAESSKNVLTTPRTHPATPILDDQISSPLNVNGPLNSNALATSNALANSVAMEMRSNQRVAPPEISRGASKLGPATSNALSPIERFKPNEDMNGLSSTKPDSTKNAMESTVTSSLAPSAEQLKLFQEMTIDPSGTFLFVIDVSLAREMTNLDDLRRLLDHYDIAWASDLEINDSVQTKLSQSRMIAEAGKSGLLADFTEPKVKLDPSVENEAANEVISLVYVKARGKRLDAAMMEVMQRTEDFPLFSFDLAFDPPTHELMNELRLIQEASLPKTSVQGSEKDSSAVHLSRQDNAKHSTGYFAAGPRRTTAMSPQIRLQSKLPLDAEMLNPVVYALFIVRHAAAENAR